MITKEVVSVTSCYTAMDSSMVVLINGIPTAIARCNACECEAAPQKAQRSPMKEKMMSSNTIFFNIIHYQVLLHPKQ